VQAAALKNGDASERQQTPENGALNIPGAYSGAPRITEGSLRGPENSAKGRLLTRGTPNSAAAGPQIACRADRTTLEPPVIPLD